MTARRVLGIAAALAAVAWLAVGGAGAWSYAHAFLVYRGFPPPRDPPGIAAGRVVHERFYSRALRAERSYDVYLPPGYDAGVVRGERFGVLYLLHGAPGKPSLLLTAGRVGVALDQLVAARRVPPFLVVMPDGRNGTFRSDTEWANTRHGRYRSFVVDVVRDADRRLPTLPDRAHRALAGYSEGGYGAVALALRRLDLFATAEAWSGYYTQTPVGPFRGASTAALLAASPSVQVPRLARRLHARPLHAFLYGGRRDPGTRQLAPFAAELAAAGGHVRARVFPGYHDWGLWRRHVPAMLRYVGARLRAAGP